MYRKSPRVQKTVDRDNSKTQPQFVDQTNIHSILKRSGMGEDMSFLARPVTYSEEEIFEHDYHDLSQKKYEMDLAFRTNLNPYDRESFGNNPENFYKYLSDPKNTSEAIERGFLVKRPNEAPPPTPVAEQKPVAPTPPSDKK